VKTLEEIKADLRRQNPKWSESKLNNEANAAFVKQQSTANKPTLDWNTPGSQKENGILIGFGINERVIPIKIESFITNLVNNDPKAYSRIRAAVRQVRGSDIKDPNLLGAYVARLATNMSGDEEVAKNVTVESWLRAAASVAGGAGTAKPELSRSVYQYSPEQIDKDINDIAQKKLGRIITDADKQAEWYQDLTAGLNKMIAGGTVTTTKLVKNKKTGKLEQVTTQTPEFTTEKAAGTIEAALVEADPISLERKQNLDFANWAFQKMGGRG
jgi:hypothetical protein